MSRTELIALEGFPLVQPGDHLPSLIQDCLHKNHLSLQDGDIVVLAQKIVSKAENRYVRLADITPSDEAKALAQKTHKDPRAMEVLLGESKEVLKTRTNVVIVEHRLGYVHANAGMDQSNISHSDEGERLLLLPKNPDQSAEKILTALQSNRSLKLAVIINDSFGRPFRHGVCGVCIGSAGIEVIDNKIGDKDLFGNTLKITEIASADEIAAAASLVMGQADEGKPVVVIRGLRWKSSQEGSQKLLRKKNEDLFRQ